MLFKAKSYNEKAQQKNTNNKLKNFPNTYIKNISVTRTKNEKSNKAKTI